MRDLQPLAGSPLIHAGVELTQYADIELGRCQGLAGDGADDVLTVPDIADPLQGFCVAAIVTCYQATPAASQDLIAVGENNNDSVRLQRMTNGRFRLYVRRSSSNLTELQTQASFGDGEQVRIAFAWSPVEGSFLLANGIEDYVLASNPGATARPAFGAASLFVFANGSGSSSATDQAAGVRCLEYYARRVTREQARELPEIPPQPGILDPDPRRPGPAIASSFADRRGGVLVPPDWRG